MTTESIQVENVVASSDIGQELDLETLSEDLGATDYDPDNFPGLVYRMHDPKAAALIFRSGKVVCTGTNSASWGSMLQPRQRLKFRILSRVGISTTHSI
jgi:transcription initiation factor TFIID TATA-box-binding protein